MNKQANEHTETSILKHTEAYWNKHTETSFEIQMAGLLFPLSFLIQQSIFQSSSLNIHQQTWEEKNKMTQYIHSFEQIQIAAKALHGQRFPLPQHSHFFGYGRSCWGSGPKGVDDLCIHIWGIFFSSIHPSIRLGLKQVSSSRSVVPLTNLL